MPSFKIAEMVPLYQTGGLPKLQIRNILNNSILASSPEPPTQIQNNFTGLFLMMHSIKIS